jgi:hypothetical protein
MIDLSRPLDSRGQDLGLDVGLVRRVVRVVAGDRCVADLDAAALQQTLEVFHQGVVLVAVADEDVVDVRHPRSSHTLYLNATKGV